MSSIRLNDPALAMADPCRRPSAPGLRNPSDGGAGEGAGTGPNPKEASVFGASEGGLRRGPAPEANGKKAYI